MATATANLVFDNSTLANFKAWAQFISNAFGVTAGWTQTADSGQVNWSTIASVPSNTFVYEMWQMSDALQSSCPVFVKVEYGFNGSTVRFRVSVGQGSDGAGNLTGAVSGPIQTNFSTNQGVTTFPCFASGDSGRIGILMWQGNGNTSAIFGIERSKDASGASTASYVTFLMGIAQQPNVANWIFLHQVAGNPNPTNSYCGVGGWICAAVPNVSLNFNGQTAALPLVPLVGQPGNPMLDWCCATFQDVTEGAFVTVNIYGSNHTYIATKAGSLSRIGDSGTGVCAILMRYE